jgi:hypothetical protein
MAGGPLGLMPSLGWVLVMGSRMCRFFLTFPTFAVTVLLTWLLWRRYLHPQRWPLLPREECLLLLTSLAMFGLNLIYVQFCDTYLIVYIPLALVALGQELRGWPRWCNNVSFLLGVLVLSLSSSWTRGSLAEEEAYWQAAETLRSSGVAPSQVAGDFNWSGYHGSFDDWIAEVGGPESAPEYIELPRHPKHMHGAYDAFLKRRAEIAEYTLQSSPPAPGDPTHQLVRKEDYPGMFFERKSVFVVRNMNREKFDIKHNRNK